LLSDLVSALVLSDSALELGVLLELELALGLLALGLELEPDAALPDDGVLALGLLELELELAPPLA
jgi:hypothetical protein